MLLAGLPGDPEVALFAAASGIPETPVHPQARLSALGRHVVGIDPGAWSGLAIYLAEAPAVRPSRSVRGEGKGQRASGRACRLRSARLHLIGSRIRVLAFDRALHAAPRARGAKQHNQDFSHGLAIVPPPPSE